MNANEQVAQMRDEPRHVDTVLLEFDIVCAFDDGDHLLDDAGHGVCGGHVAARESRIDEVQCERHRLVARQGTAQIGVHRVDQRQAFGVFVGIERPYFRLKRIFDALFFLRTLDRAAEMVGERHD